MFLLLVSESVNQTFMLFIKAILFFAAVPNEAQNRQNVLLQKTHFQYLVIPTLDCSTWSVFVSGLSHGLGQRCLVALFFLIVRVSA